MGVRFRKSIKVAPGVKLNINKKSVGVSVGTKGARVSASTSGRKTTSVGIPGTGISYVSSKTSTNTKPMQSSNHPMRSQENPIVSNKKSGFVALLILGILLLVLAIGTKAIPGFIISCGIIAFSIWKMNKK